MEEDAARVRAISDWPILALPMKSQPWIEKKGFGRIEGADLLIVVEHGGNELHTYASVEELVKVWSVD